MQPSQIQLLDMRYLGIKVWPRETEKDDEQDAEQFDFNGVLIGEKINVYPFSKDDANSVYVVMLNILIENKEGKTAPYDIDVCVAGHFSVHKNVTKERVVNLVTVNGCSILYSAIRELVMTLTIRSINGMLTLPTVNFLDKIPENSPPEKEDSPKPEKAAKKKSG